MSLEEIYISRTPIEHRKTHGQFYTSKPIADFMIQWLSETNPNNIYDPAFGMGAFYYSSLRSSFKGKFSAGEKDDKSFSFYKESGDFKNLDLINEDYFSNWDRRWDSIVCNPPYLKFQKFLDRKEVFKKIDKALNIKVSGHTNIASAFLLKSISELNENGRLAYIMPLEFLNTGYGKVVKKALLENGSIRKIIQVTDEVGAFDSVTTTVCIIFFEKTISKDPIKFSKITDAINIKVQDIRSVNPLELKPEDKWLSLFEKGQDSDSSNPSGFVPLKNYGKFKRGIATGANEFFSLNKSKIKDMNIMSSEVSLCLTKSNQVKSSFFTQNDLENLIETDSPIFVFNPTQDTKNLSKGALEYIKHGEAQEYHTRYLTKNRKTWYSLEKREPFPILFGVFSRGDYKIIRNETEALSLTTFHGFQPNVLGKKYIDRIYIFLKSELGSEALIKHRRKYGGDLNKFEPSDLNSIHLPSPEQLDLISEEFVRKALTVLKENDQMSEEANKELAKALKLTKNKIA